MRTASGTRPKLSSVIPLPLPNRVVPSPPPPPPSSRKPSSEGVPSLSLPPLPPAEAAGVPLATPPAVPDEEDTSKVPVDQLLLQQSRRPSMPSLPRLSRPEDDPFVRPRRRWPLVLLALVAAALGGLFALRTSRAPEVGPVPEPSVAPSATAERAAPEESTAPSVGTPEERAPATATPRSVKRAPSRPTRAEVAPSIVPPRPVETRPAPPPIEPGMDLQGKPAARPHRTLDEKDPYAP
ncbi:MAG TPA: hypothetical protein VHE30_26895 [Polyangiaceae bacterium]|nr:hypothetical protein [Polyangiaceae bacterium]